MGQGTNQRGNYTTYVWQIYGSMGDRVPKNIARADAHSVSESGSADNVPD
jgi:hypothetical protein